MSEEKLEYIYEKYVSWKARPIPPSSEDSTYPQTPEEFAAKYGIDKFTLDDFTKRPGHYELVARESIGWAKSRIPEIIHAIYADAKKIKSPETAERFISMITELNKAMKPEGSSSGGLPINNFNFFGNIDDEKYKRIIEREAKRCASPEGGTVESD